MSTPLRSPLALRWPRCRGCGQPLGSGHLEVGGQVPVGEVACVRAQVDAFNDGLRTGIIEMRAVLSRVRAQVDAAR